MLAPHRLLSRSFRSPAAAFRVRTEDGIVLTGTRVGESGPALVLCHGFLGWHRKKRIGAFAEWLAGSFVVYGFDFRGHGRSEGISTFGDLEYLDVDAIVRHALREHGGPVVTAGVSMGAVAAIRQAAYRPGADVVVAISSPAQWQGHRSREVMRMRRLRETPAGRRLARALGYRLAPTWTWPETPEALAGRIAPRPLILVHGEDDRFFDIEEAHRLYRAAREPKRLMVASRFGHAEDGLTPAFAELIGRRIREALRMSSP